jgi:YYY domain-containing protein
MAVGVIAAVFVMLIGNLGEVKLIAEEVAKLGEPDVQSLNTTLPVLKDLMKLGNGFGKLLSGGQELPIPANWYYWNPTRIIPADPGEAGPITEFPFFTFLYADLHAHMMALPITILLLGLAVSWLTRLPLARARGAEQPDSSSVAPDSPSITQYRIRNMIATRLIEWLKTNGAGVLSLLLGGLSIGALRATNTADYPTYLIIAAAALFFGTWAAEAWRFKATWFAFAARVGLLLVSSLVLFAPFAQSDRLGSAVIDGWLGSKTPLQEYLYVHGIFLFPIVTYLFVELRRWGWRWLGAVWNRLSEWRWALGVAGGVAALAIVYIWLALDAPVAVVAGPLMLVLFALMLRPHLPALTRFWLLIVLLSVSLSLVVEVAVFRGDISRMNMVFKFYYQVWVLLGIAGAVALGWLWQRGPIATPKLNGGWSPERRRDARLVRSGGWQTVMVVLVTGGLLYPPFAARAKLSERFTEGAPPGLDGMAYMRDGVYYEADELEINHELHLRWDYDAITWMQDHIAGTPVIAEGRSKHEYLWGNRVSIYTGLPAIVGWAHHQRQQRGAAVPHSVIEQRILDVALLFGDPSQVTARKILDRYNVKYIYVGELEKAYYLPEALAKFEQMARDGELRVVYANPGVTIYEVVRD